MEGTAHRLAGNALDSQQTQIPRAIKPRSELQIVGSCNNDLVTTIFATWSLPVWSSFP